MCGIAGIFQLHGTPVQRHLIEGMCQSLVHRGPDDSGIHIDGSVGLAHTRLSVIDLSSDAKQPMFNEDRTVVLVFNGEIYNFAELREHLIKSGHQFRSHTDSEVIVHLYEDCGVQCLEDLEGMFAFGIWDKRNHRLFLARDRLGKKPLYYSLSGSRIIFASEINALRVIKDIDLSIDFNALDSYLEYQFIPAPLTIYKGIKKLPPAHYILVESDKFIMNRYWELAYTRKLKISFREALEEGEKKIEQAVKKRLVSDVPLGALLSGGVDSSLVVYFMSKLSDRPVKTFSAGFREEEFNELPYASKVSQVCRTEHLEIIITPKIQDDLPEIVSRYGEPFADKSMVPTYYICREARQNVKVALSGDGGDELCLGYDKYSLPRLLREYMKLPARLRMHLLDILEVARGKILIGGKLMRALVPECKVLTWNDFWWDYYKERLYRREFKPNISRHFRSERIRGFLLRMNSSALEPEEKLLWADIHNYLPDDLLVKIDIASMAHSLEIRSPFLDHKLIEFFSQIPLQYKLWRGEPKYILKKIAAEHLPKDLVYRPKRGFAMPVDQWIRDHFSQLVGDYVLENTALWDFFSKEYFSKIYKEYREGCFQHGQRIWAILVLGIWLKESLKYNKI